VFYDLLPPSLSRHLRSFLQFFLRSLVAAFLPTIVTSFPQHANPPRCIVRREEFLLPKNVDPLASDFAGLSFLLAKSPRCDFTRLNNMLFTLSLDFYTLSFTMSSFPPRCAFPFHVRDEAYKPPNLYPTPHTVLSWLHVPSFEMLVVTSSLLVTLRNLFFQVFLWDGIGRTSLGWLHIDGSVFTASASFSYPIPAYFSLHSQPSRGAFPPNFHRVDQRTLSVSQVLVFLRPERAPAPQFTTPWLDSSLVPGGRRLSTGNCRC